MIGCVAVTEPVFFEPDSGSDAVGLGPQHRRGPEPDLAHGEGQRLWQACLERAVAVGLPRYWTLDALDGQRTGRPVDDPPPTGTGQLSLGGA